MKKLYRLYAILFITILYNSATIAQEDSEPITIGFEQQIESNILQETRPLLIHLPNGYEEGDKQYPVIYLLDGRGHFHHTTGTMQFLARSGRMPEMIIVGIPNTTDRTRDLTPVITGDEKRFATAGGADNMVKFINDELVPFIDKKYRTTPYKLLIGHSFGGLFAIHAMVHHAEVFNAYVAISPSLWWDNQVLVDQADSFLEKNPEYKASLYMTMGNEGGAMLGGAWKLAAILEEKAPKSLSWEFHLMEDEDHGSVPHRSTYNGLEAIFSDWKIEDAFALYQAGGLQAIDNHYANLKSTLGLSLEAPEQMINTLGYRLLGNSQVDEAIEVFARNVKDHPKSFNTYDSLAEGYKIKGEKEKAITYYKKSLALNPGNTNGIKMLAELGVTYEPTKLEVSVKQMERYAGKYQMGSGEVINITLAGKDLFGEGPGKPKVKLVPMAKHKFYLNDENVQVTFHQNDQNQTKSLSISAGEQKMTAEKME